MMSSQQWHPGDPLIFGQNSYARSQFYDKSLWQNTRASPGLCRCDDVTSCAALMMRPGPFSFSSHQEGPGNPSAGGFINVQCPQFTVWNCITWFSCPCISVLHCLEKWRKWLCLKDRHFLTTVCSSGCFQWQRWWWLSTYITLDTQLYDSILSSGKMSSLCQPIVNHFLSVSFSGLKTQLPASVFVQGV